MILTKIISGGQTGVDQGALFAAEACRIATGGWMPKNFMTETGSSPEIAKLFGMQELNDSVSLSRSYAIRTGRNVFDSDGTVQIATDFTSRGEICTTNAIKRHGKPSLRIHPDCQDSISAAEDIAAWIESEEIKTLNVAGNRSSTWPDAFGYTVAAITRAIEILRGK